MSRVLCVLLAVGALAFAAPADGKPDVDVSPLMSLTAGGGAVWAWANDYRLIRIDPATMAVTHRVDTRPGVLLDLAVGGGWVWGAGRCGRPRCDYSVVMRFDPLTGRRAGVITRLGMNARAVTFGFGAVWVLGDRRVLRIDPRTRRMVGRPVTVGGGARDIAAGEGGVWVTTGPRRGPTGATVCDLVGIDPRAGRVVRRQPVGCPAGQVAVGAGGIWASSSSGRGVVRVAPFGRRVALPGVQLGGEGVDIAADADGVWVARVRDITATPRWDRRGRVEVSRLDPRGRVVGRPLVLGPAYAWLPRVAVDAGGAWVANTPTGTVTRVEPDGAITRVVVPAGR